MTVRTLATSLVALLVIGCFSGDDFDPAFGRSEEGCALTLFCEPEMEEIRICNSMSQCVAPFESQGIQPPVRQSDSSVVNLQDEAPVIRLTSQYLQDLIAGANVGVVGNGYSLFSVYAKKLVIDGTPTSDDPGAPRVFNVDPELARVVEIGAQEIWIRHGTVFQSARPETSVTFRLIPQENLYVDKDVSTDGIGACPCIQMDASRIESVTNSITTGHNCIDAPTCAELANGGN